MKLALIATVACIFLPQKLPPKIFAERQAARHRSSEADAKAHPDRYLLRPSFVTTAKINMLWIDRLGIGDDGDYQGLDESHSAVDAIRSDWKTSGELAFSLAVMLYELQIMADLEQSMSGHQSKRLMVSTGACGIALRKARDEGTSPPWYPECEPPEPKSSSALQSRRQHN